MEVDVNVHFENVGANTDEGRKLVQEVANFFRNTLIIGTYRTPLMIAAGDSHDLEIGSAFIQKWSDWADAGEIDKMKKIKRLKDELKDLFGYKFFDIRVDKEKSGLIVTNDDGEFMLKELGNGIGQFIMILAKALMKNPSYIFIDEPEISLHPKMQEIFTRALAAKSKFGLLATSHSIALARSVADTIYTLTRDEKNIPHVLPYGEHYNPTISQSINEMSYSQYVEIGGNNILLVEGRTDIKSFREILRKYGIEKEYIIISFGGSQFMTKDGSKIIEELSEISRLNPKSISVIFDSEKTSSSDVLKKEFEVFKNACESLGFKVFPTDRHSIENYLTQEVITKVIGSSYKALGPFEKFGLNNEKWAKEKNWLMFLEMAKEDFAGTELDQFIISELIPRKKV